MDLGVAVAASHRFSGHEVCALVHEMLDHRQLLVHCRTLQRSLPLCAPVVAVRSVDRRMSAAGASACQGAERSEGVSVRWQERQRCGGGRRRCVVMGDGVTAKRNRQVGRGGQTTSSSFASMLAPFARILSIRVNWLNSAAQWRGVLPFCDGEAEERG